MNHSEDLQEQIAEYRAANAARRARAFIDCPDYVLGQPLNPINPKTWTMLCASQSRFLLGQDVMEGDVRNYIWFHSKLFTFGMWAPLLKWFALLRLNYVLGKKNDVDWYSAAIALAASDISAHIEDAIADASKGGNEGSPGPCLEAQLSHLFAEKYGWHPKDTCGIPLRKLFQYVRCINPSDDDEGERQIRFAHLKKRNDELAAEKAAKPI